VTARVTPPPMAVVVLCVLGCVGCGTTTPDSSSYREQARLAVGAALSEVRTVETLLRAEDEGKTLGGYPTAMLRSNGDSLATAERSFTSLLPPAGEDRTATRTADLLTRAGAQVGAAALAEHRGDRSSYPDLTRRLEQTATALERWQGQLG
jgi:hypothetical protein